MSNKYVISKYLKVPTIEYFNIDFTKLPAPDPDYKGAFYHCDDLSDAEGCLPACVKAWVDHNRLPASDKWKERDNGINPVLFATENNTGARVKVNMASMFGDVGISTNLLAENGYDRRVCLTHLSDFSQEI